MQYKYVNHCSFLVYPASPQHISWKQHEISCCWVSNKIHRSGNFNPKPSGSKIQWFTLKLTVTYVQLTSIFQIYEVEVCSYVPLECLILWYACILARKLMKTWTTENPTLQIWNFSLTIEFRQCCLMMKTKNKNISTPDNWRISRHFVFVTGPRQRKLNNAKNFPDQTLGRWKYPYLSVVRDSGILSSANM